MEEISAVEATIITTIIGGLITLVVTLINKYKPIKKKDQTQLNFDRMDKFIEKQEEDRNRLYGRIELLEKRLEEVEREGRDKDDRILELEEQLRVEKERSARLEKRVTEIKRVADKAAATKKQEDKTNTKK